jgi:hypothetical protein
VDQDEIFSLSLPTSKLLEEVSLVSLEYVSFRVVEADTSERLDEDRESDEYGLPLLDSGEASGLLRYLFLSEFTTSSCGLVALSFLHSVSMVTGAGMLGRMN